MSKVRMLMFAVVGVLFSCMTVFAQGAEDNASSVSKYRALAAGIGFAIAVLGGALGQAGEHHGLGDAGDGELGAERRGRR